MADASVDAHRPPVRGLSGVLGALDASLADAQLVADLEAAHGAADPHEALLSAVVGRQGWLGACWWRLEDGRARARAWTGLLGPDPRPRLGVGPLGRALRDELPDGVRPAAEELECPRCRLALRAGAVWVGALRTGGQERGGVLELVGAPPGGVGPERVALLRHVAWLAGLDPR